MKYLKLLNTSNLKIYSKNQGSAEVGGQDFYTENNDPMRLSADFLLNLNQHVDKKSYIIKKYLF